jgi:hypothetical protein
LVYDYPTQLAAIVDGRQREAAGRNRWLEFLSATAELGADWEFYTLTNGPIAAAVARDPGAHRGAEDPEAIIDRAEHRELVPELRGFFATLDRSRVMDRLDELASPSRFVAPRTTEALVESSLPELGRARLGAKICAARMRLSALDGKSEQAVRSLRHGLAISEAALGRGVVIGYLAADTCRATMEREVRMELLEGLIDGPTCGVMLEVLGEDSLLNLAAAIGGERFVALDAIERYFDQASREAATQEQRNGTGEAGAEETAPREKQMALANRYFDAAARVVDVDGINPTEREHAWADVRAVETIVQDRAHPRAYAPLRSLLLDLPRLMSSRARNQAMRAGTRVMLALEAFRVRTGRYPDTLRELAMPQMPDDPFAPGRPLGYRVLSPSGSGPAAYVLYSTGADGRDDGGAAADGVSGRGPDLIINSREP